MKKIYTLLFSAIFAVSGLMAQTSGTLTCVYTTTSTGGYTPKNVLAAWIETGTGTFVKTKFHYGSQDDHLTNWTAHTGYNNYTDATTGSTRTSNGVMTLVWNGTDLSAAVMTDGTYKVWVEFAWASSMTTGKTLQSWSFTKGATISHAAPTDTTNFTGITLDWVPAGVGVTENFGSQDFVVSPNPVNATSTINYHLTETSDVTLSVFDLNGKLVKVIFDGNQSAGAYNIPVAQAGSLKAGVYLIKLYTGKASVCRKLIITE